MTRPVLLGGYAAKSCARATHNAYDETVPAQPSAISEDLQRLFDLGIEHERALFDSWLALGADVVDLRPFEGEKDAHVAATLQALEEGRLVILGGRLPDDAVGGRTGKPDVLLRDAAGGYHPGDVKAHLVLDKKKTGGVVAFLDAPALMQATTMQNVGLRHDPCDLLQLAHYWRMLQACEHAAASAWGAIVGTDPGPLPQLAWYELDEPRFITFSRTKGKATRSCLERYDHEHNFRVRVAQTAQQRRGLRLIPPRSSNRWARKSA